MEARTEERPGLQLALATAAFAACFAAFGSLSAMMPDVRRLLHLTDSQKWLAISLPVLLGSVGRLPLGILADKLGGRLVFALTLVASIVPVVLLGLVDSYPMLLICGFLVGIALASFSVGVSFVSPWYPAGRQGF
ncbi:MAG TPA: MFS transporter, partial [Myxococcaceae bacterium]|nr:MFS transporter [Myxococcaceae bacterium]